MKLNIAVTERYDINGTGFLEKEIEKEPFEYMGVKLFVHIVKDIEEIDVYHVSEYSTGSRLIGYIQVEENIRSEIKAKFDSIGVDKIKQRIAETIKKYGVANK